MSKPALRLRGYQRSDLEALYQLDRICFNPPFRFSKVAMRQFAEAANARVILGEVNGELAGFCIAHLHEIAEETIGYITTIDVHPSFQRRGIATVLLKATEAQVKAEGATASVLHVFAENASAIQFYKRLGYILLESVVNFYGAGLTADVYSKSLVESPAL